MHLPAVDLHRVCYNALLWTPGKGDAAKSPTEGLARLDIWEKNIALTASDGYVAVVSWAKTEGEAAARETVWLTNQELRELEQKLRNKTETDDAIFSGDTFPDPPHIPTNEKFWVQLQQILANQNFVPNPDLQWSLNPSRLSKMSLLKPQGKYPLTFLHGESAITNQRIIKWKYGPHTHGVVVPLLRELLDETYGEKIKDVVWQ